VADPQTPHPAGGPGPAPRPGQTRKLALRDQLLTTRRRRSLLASGEAARAIARHLLDTPEVRRAASVAAYVSMPGEPGTGDLIDLLHESGRRVLLPVLLPDGDLDWAAYAGEGTLRPALRGMLEPVGPRLGVEAIAGADVVLVPGLAVARDGMRLGRGGGSYDRALARVPLGTFTCVLLHDDEVGVEVPVEPHDRPVRAAVSPAGLTRLG
jgi:5-formyltetrahydrofolate cyclo-ligase